MFYQKKQQRMDDFLDWIELGEGERWYEILTNLLLCCIFHRYLPYIF